jgi:hypothetical protein
MLGYSLTVVFCYLVVTYGQTRCDMIMKGDQEAAVMACFTIPAFCYILWRKPSNQEVRLGYDCQRFKMIASWVSVWRVHAATLSDLLEFSTVFLHI